jgi:hypothetical protein
MSENGRAIGWKVLAGVLSIALLALWSQHRQQSEALSSAEAELARAGAENETLTAKLDSVQASSEDDQAAPPPRWSRASAC